MGRVSVSQTQVKVVGGFAVKGKAEPFVKGSSARIGFKHGEDDATFLIASVGDQLSADGCTKTTALIFRSDAKRVQLDVLRMVDGSEESYRGTIVVDDRSEIK
jgi:hypothetical protein